MSPPVVRRSTCCRKISRPVCRDPISRVSTTCDGSQSATWVTFEAVTKSRSVSFDSFPRSDDRSRVRPHVLLGGSKRSAVLLLRARNKKDIFWNKKKTRLSSNFILPRNNSRRSNLQKKIFFTTVTFLFLYLIIQQEEMGGVFLYQEICNCFSFFLPSRLCEGNRPGFVPGIGM